jgi:acetyl-CoA acyltransferase
MRDAVIIEAVRSPLGKRGKGLADVHPVDLAASMLNAVVDRTQIDPALVDDVIWGCVTQALEQAANTGRMAVLAAGWPDTVPSTTIDRQCGSSQQAVAFATAGLVAGQYDVVVAGGVESMTRVPIGASFDADHLPISPRYVQRYGDGVPNQGLSAELIATKWNLSRAALDEFAAASHHKAAAATTDGRFAAQIVRIDRPDADPYETDEGIRAATSVEALAGLPPVFKEDGRITAGNSSQISDGAAAILLTTSARAAELGLRPIARIHTSVVAATDPVMMLTAPIPATAKALAAAGLSIDDIGVFEVNEAFASIPLAWIAETGADSARVNPNGGAIALGHPLGGSGARLMTTMVHRMRDHGIQYGLQTMCEGGGQANATILELMP